MRRGLLASLALSIPTVALSQASSLPASINNATAMARTACTYWNDMAARPRPAEERDLIAAFRDVSRRGDTLKLDRLTFVNERGEQEIDQRLFSFAGRLTATPTDLVWDRPYEGVRYIVIDRLVRGDRGVAYLEGIPVSSPDGTLLASAASDAVFDPRGVNILVRGPRGYDSGFNDDTIPYPCDLAWDGNDRLNFKVAVNPDEGPTAFAPAYIAREDGRWVYHPPAP